MATQFPNRYRGNCFICATSIAAGAGLCMKDDAGKWQVRCQAPCKPAPAAKPAPAKATPNVGDLSGIFSLFAKAQSHLKSPAIVVGIPELAANGQWLRDDKGRLVMSNTSFRVNVAGERAKVHGSLTVVDANRDAEAQRNWFGRILVDGTFQSSKAGSAIPGLAKRLTEFAASPSTIAGEDGRLHGRCCFCRLPLKNERSTAAGYGKICADHFGLEWGARPVEFAASAA